MAIINHVLYLLISAAFTIAVGRSLFRSGRLFLVECFRNDHIAETVNRLFLIGFYLLNTAFVCIALRYGTTGETVVETIEMLGTRIGTVVMTMGVMHFNNLYWCKRIRSVYPAVEYA